MALLQRVRKLQYKIRREGKVCAKLEEGGELMKMQKRYSEKKEVEVFSSIEQAQCVGLVFLPWLFDRTSTYFSCCISKTRNHAVIIHFGEGPNLFR